MCRRRTTSTARGNWTGYHGGWPWHSGLRELTVNFQLEGQEDRLHRTRVYQVAPYTFTGRDCKGREIWVRVQQMLVGRVTDKDWRVAELSMDALSGMLALQHLYSGV